MQKDVNTISYMFERNKYYSQTEVLKKYKISLKQFRDLLKNMNVIKKKIDLGNYEVITCYVLKEELESLDLELKPK